MRMGELPVKGSVRLLAFFTLLFVVGPWNRLSSVNVAASQRDDGQAGLTRHFADVPDGTLNNLSVSTASGRDENNTPTRLALGPDNTIYVSDAPADAVFIFDAELNPVNRIEGIGKPLGVAVAANGNLYVGSDTQDEVQVYDQNGVKIRTLGAGTVAMPNDLVLDRRGWLYVADSHGNRVWIFDPTGALAGSAGTAGDEPGQLDFPVAVTIGYRTEGTLEVGELFVADQGHGRVQVFDLQGHFLRAYGDRVKQETVDTNGRGKFAKMQSLAVDGRGRLHVLDSYMNQVQILDAQTGAAIDAYGAFGTAPGQLNLPLDILISDSKVIVANAGNKCVEVIYTIP